MQLDRNASSPSLWSQFAQNKQTQTSPQVNDVSLAPDSKSVTPSETSEKTKQRSLISKAQSQQLRARFQSATNKVVKMNQVLHRLQALKPARIDSNSQKFSGMLTQTLQQYEKSGNAASEILRQLTSMGNAQQTGNGSIANPQSAESVNNMAQKIRDDLYSKLGSEEGIEQLKKAIAHDTATPEQQELFDNFQNDFEELRTAIKTLPEEDRGKLKPEFVGKLHSVASRLGLIGQLKGGAGLKGEQVQAIKAKADLSEDEIQTLAGEVIDALSKDLRPDSILAKYLPAAAAAAASSEDEATPKEPPKLIAARMIIELCMGGQVEGFQELKPAAKPKVNPYSKPLEMDDQRMGKLRISPKTALKPTDEFHYYGPAKDKANAAIELLHRTLTALESAKGDDDVTMPSHEVMRILQQVCDDLSLCEKGLTIEVTNRKAEIARRKRESLPQDDTHPRAVRWDQYALHRIQSSKTVVNSVIERLISTGESVKVQTFTSRPGYKGIQRVDQYMNKAKLIIVPMDTRTDPPT